MATSFPDPDKLKKDIHAALKGWHTVGGTADDLLESLLIVQQRRLAGNSGDNPALLRQVTSAVLLEGIEEMAAHDAERAHILRLRFLDGKSIAEVSYMLDISEDSVNRRQREGIQNVTKIIHARETAARQTLAQTMEVHLPPATYTALFGVDELQQKLQWQLLHEESPGVVALVGIGGIGKTAVADKVTR